MDSKSHQQYIKARTEYVSILESWACLKGRPLLSKYCTVIMMYRSQGGAIIILCTHHNSLNSTSYAPKVELMLLSYVYNDAVQLWVK